MFVLLIDKGPYYDWVGAEWYDVNMISNDLWNCISQCVCLRMLHVYVCVEDVILLLANKTCYIHPCLLSFLRSSLLSIYLADGTFHSQIAYRPILL